MIVAFSKVKLQGHFCGKGPVQKIFKKKSKIHPGWFCLELSEDSKTVSCLSVRQVLSSQWFFKVDGALH